MSIFESSWETPDRVRLYTRTWLPEAAVRAAVVLVHGLGEHCSRYDHVAAAFNAEGLAVYSFDHRGHGNSQGKRGHIPSFEAVFGDIGHFIATAREAHPGAPVFLYGHSLGGLLVLDYSLRRKPDLSGVICTSPGLAVGDGVPPAKLFAARTLGVLAPSFTLPNGLDVQNLSNDPAVVQAYIHDPLNTDQVSARLGLDLIKEGPWVIAHAGDWALPLLLMQGAGDHIVSPKATARFAAGVPKQFITYREWEGMFHETHNEVNKAQVIQAMLDWLNHHIGA